MASSFRKALFNQICVAAEQFSSLKLNLSEDLLPILVTLPRGQNIKCNPTFHINFYCVNGKIADSKLLSTAFINQFQSNDLLVNVHQESNSVISVEGRQCEFMKQILYQVIQLKEKYGFHNNLYMNLKKEKIGIDFSSPNVAKPFHAGHLRSTIIGNFIANIYKALGHHVTRINYFGDWGTQFGILSVGFRRFGSEQLLQSAPMNHLLDVYVQSCHLAETNASFYQEAKDYFTRLESGDEDSLRLWKTFKDLSIVEYNKSYKRLGITFDIYEWESEYAKKAKEVLRLLQEQNLLQELVDGTKAVYLLEEDKKVVVAKSDGSTLYLTRDIAAALYRIKEYDLDHMLYVVETGQFLHFEHLFNILKLLEVSKSRKFSHIKFGRIQKMSTRKGNVVFLNDILEESKIRSLQTMKASSNTKVNTDLESVADRLGISAIFINDLKHCRTKDYVFNWESVVNVKGDTGIRLQYAHARLCSLERNFDLSPSNVDTSLLKEKEAIQLVQEIARFEDVVYRAYKELEPYIVVNYLFSLSSLVNLAYKTLNIKNVDAKLSQARLLLFHCARITLSNGLQLLGLQALEKI